VGTLSKLRRMVRRDGLSVRASARRLGISRTTASKWLAMGEMVQPRYPRRLARAGVLDAYKEQLSTWLCADSHRGKRERRGIKAMFEAIRAMGYRGSRGPVYAYCKHWREEQASAPRKAGFVPLSFDLGEAFQFDWSCEYAFVGGLRRRLEVAHMKLAASRAFMLVAYYSQAHEMLFDAHARGVRSAANRRVQRVKRPSAWHSTAERKSQATNNPVVPAFESGCRRSRCTP